MYYIEVVNWSTMKVIDYQLGVSIVFSASMHDILEISGFSKSNFMGKYSMDILTYPRTWLDWCWNFFQNFHIEIIKSACAVICEYKCKIPPTLKAKINVYVLPNCSSSLCWWYNINYSINYPKGNGKMPWLISLHIWALSPLQPLPL